MKPVYFLPTARKYIEELQEIANTQDDKALARWSEEKKALQSMRLTVSIERIILAFFSFLVLNLNANSAYLLF